MKSVRPVIEHIKAKVVGEVWKGGLSVVFFEYKGATYEAHRFNGWIPKEVTHKLTFAKPDPKKLEREVFERVVTIVKSHLLHK